MFTPQSVSEGGNTTPLGCRRANSWTRENTTGNNFLANGGTELNATSNLYDLAYRHYDPVLGRMNGVDPMASKYSSLTPYNFSFNDPVTFADPRGADPADHYFYGGYFTYDDWIPQRNLGWQTSLDRSGAGRREFGQSLSSFGGGGYWYGDLNLDLNAMADGAHFFGFSNGLLTSHTHLSPTEVLGLGSAYNEAFVGGTTGPILSDFTGGPRLWQGSNGDYVTFSGGVAMVPYTDITYESYLAGQSIEESIPVHEIAVTITALANGYSGFTEARAGLALALLPSGISQIIGAYMLVDGVARMAATPIQIVSTWNGWETERWPSNFLGIVGMIADNTGSKRTIVGGNYQTWMEIGGDFGLSKQRIIQNIETTISNPNILRSINTMKDIVMPYYKSGKEVFDSSKNPK